MTQTQRYFSLYEPFTRLPPNLQTELESQTSLLRYRLGQILLHDETMPHQVMLILEGDVRLLTPNLSGGRLTLERIGTGDCLGWVGLLRNRPCEHAIASTDVTVAVFPASLFRRLLQEQPSLLDWFGSRSTLSELYAIASRHPNPQTPQGKELIQRLRLAAPGLKALALPPGDHELELNAALEWQVASDNLQGYRLGDVLPSRDRLRLTVGGDWYGRLVGLPSLLEQVPGPRQSGTSSEAAIPAIALPEHIPTGPDFPPVPDLSNGQTRAYPHFSGLGPIEGSLACIRMLAQHYQLPLRQDVVRRVLTEQIERTGQPTLPLMGAVSEMIGLRAQLLKAPAHRFGYLEPPALIAWQDSFAVVFETNSHTLVLGIPNEGIRRLSVNTFEELWGSEGEVLQLRRTEHTPTQKFGLSWFWPSIQKYRVALIEVLVASLFVQLFQLANPLIVQQIIDKVIVQNGFETLNVLGALLVAVAIFEAILTSLRTYLFVDTTNRIDLSLGSEIIDHLLRLPLRYFERRPVGELSSRIAELENIRRFLTGTALTVVLDAIFSVIYILVMFVYSWLLALVALVTIPLFVALTVLVSPILRAQLRRRAERNAETQSHLVEVLTGIQTVKAQNIELKSRWTWQERYSKYVAEGFRNVITSTAAGSLSNFLNQLSGLLVLWVGAYLVLQGQLTLGQLIAFRIIAGYVTSPLLRLAQLWQNFQETALSLERLSDIIDNPREAEDSDRRNIPMPVIDGKVRFEDLSFRFRNDGPLQLVNVDLEIQAGTFVGIVGQSGSGKSTLMKLLPRLYNPLSGRILIDDYDIAKVELYSLRRQIGIVPQDSLLFEGSVQDNISLTNPEASSDEIIAAARVACAHDFIMELPAGYNSPVGERGGNLSGGQRQRIAIARTILQNPRMLVMDEATSALDPDTERQVSQNLKQAFAGRTVFYITHRLNTIRHADKILMMDKGAVVESGTHEQLMALKGRYYCLYQQQEAGN